MKFKVNIVSEAEDDLIEIYKYVYRNDNEQNADTLFNKLLSKCLSLDKFPKRGHVPPELELIGIEEYLEIHYKPYRIVYKIIDNEVFIYCIIDGKRDMQKILQERLFREN